jgi:hypothetical protein
VTDPNTADIVRGLLCHTCDDVVDKRRWRAESGALDGGLDHHDSRRFRVADEPDAGLGTLCRNLLGGDAETLATL